MADHFLCLTLDQKGYYKGVGRKYEDNEEEEERPIKGQVNAVTRQKKQQEKYAGKEAGLVIFITATTTQFFKAALFHPLPSPWNFPRMPNLRNFAFISLVPKLSQNPVLMTTIYNIQFYIMRPLPTHGQQPTVTQGCRYGYNQLP